jgi:hypothetical protein
MQPMAPYILKSPGLLVFPNKWLTGSNSDPKSGDLSI